MFKFNAKLYIILLIILAILFILILVLPYGKKKQPAPTATIPTPTLVRLNPTKAPIPLPKPTSTGGQEVIPQSIESYAIQKQNLRKKTPVNENGFTITYDYANDQFTVLLQKPIAANRELFNTWLQQNYPLIPQNKFIFKQ